MHRALVMVASVLVLGLATVQAGAQVAAEPETYRSYRALGQGFAGTVAGGYSAEDLIDREVVGAGGEEIAEVEDLLVAPGEDIQAAVLDVGGLLGIGSRKVAVPLDRFRLGPGDDELVLEMTEEELETLPELGEEEGVWRVED